MTYITDDPIADYNRHQAEIEKWLAKRPECADCGEPVQDEYFYLINDEVICPDCLKNNYRKNVEDYIEGGSIYEA